TFVGVEQGVATPVETRFVLQAESTVVDFRTSVQSAGRIGGYSQLLTYGGEAEDNPDQTDAFWPWMKASWQSSGEQTNHNQDDAFWPWQEKASSSRNDAAGFGQDEAFAPREMDMLWAFVGTNFGQRSDQAAGASLPPQAVDSALASIELVAVEKCQSPVGSLSMNGTEEALMECNAAEILIQPAAEQAKTGNEVGNGEGKCWLSLAAGITGIYSWMFGKQRRQSDKTWQSVRKRAMVQ